MKKLFEVTEVDITDIVVGRAHRIGRTYKNRVSNNERRGIIVRFDTSRHRTMLYRARTKLKRVKVRLDLTKLL